MTATERILVIKLGALGDFMYALGAMRAIREHHPAAYITLLTQKPYEALARKTGFFDAVMLDPRPKYNPLHWLTFKKDLNACNFTRVYDLQNNDRTGLYFKLFSPKPEWSGIAEGASHRNTDPDRNKSHAFLGHRNTLAIAGIPRVDIDPLDWMQSDTSRFNLKKPYALLVPGSAPSRPNKRWPWKNFRALASELIESGIHPVILGASSEEILSRAIAENIDITNLTGQTTLDDIASLARESIISIGNDTGPMHMISMTGCPSIFFFRSDESTIQKHGPQSAQSESFEASDLEDIKVGEVWDKARKIIHRRGLA